MLSPHPHPRLLLFAGARGEMPPPAALPAPSTREHTRRPVTPPQQARTHRPWFRTPLSLPSRRDLPVACGGIGRQSVRSCVRKSGCPGREKSSSAGRPGGRRPAAAAVIQSPGQGRKDGGGRRPHAKTRAAHQGRLSSPPVQSGGHQARPPLQRKRGVILRPGRRQPARPAS